MHPRNYAFRNAKGHNSIYVTVIGNNEKKDFKIKTKHFSKL